MNNLVIKQKYSSANTSVNIAKMPRIYGRIDPIFWKNKRVFDYGCGNAKTQHLLNYYITSKLGHWCGYDLTYAPTTYSKITEADIIICANTLCVIHEDEIVQSIINNIVKTNVPFVIQIYEGDKTGIGRATSADSWQRNTKTKEFLTLFNWDVPVIVYKGFIIRKTDKEIFRKILR